MEMESNIARAFAPMRATEVAGIADDEAILHVPLRGRRIGATDLRPTEVTARRLTIPTTDQAESSVRQYLNYFNTFTFRPLTRWKALSPLRNM